MRSPGPAHGQELYSPGGTPLSPHTQPAEDYVPVPVAPRVAPPTESVPEPEAPAGAPPAPEADGDAYHRTRRPTQAQAVPANEFQSHRTRATMTSAAPKMSRSTVQAEPTQVNLVTQEPEATMEVVTQAEPTLAPSPVSLRAEQVPVKLDANTKNSETPADFSVPKPVLEVRRIPAVEADSAHNVPVNSEEIMPLPEVNRNRELAGSRTEPTLATAPAAPEAPQVMPAKSHLANLVANPLRANEVKTQRVSGPVKSNPLR